MLVNKPILVSDYLSDEGLEETKKVFWKESRDLLSTHHDIAVNTSQKLPTIIHEYFLLIGNSKYSFVEQFNSVLVSVYLGVMYFILSFSVLSLKLQMHPSSTIVYGV